MKVFLKLILLAGIVVFALYDYRLLSFQTGLSKTSFEDKSTLEALQALTNVQKVEYYANPFKSNDDDAYKVYIVTKDEAYLIDAAESDISGFAALGIFSSNFQPTKISPVPFYVEIIVGLVVLVVPFGRRRR